MNKNSYSESKEFWREPVGAPRPESLSDTHGIEERLCEYVLSHSQKGNPQDVINKIDEFCEKNWMMNLGPEKGRIVRAQMKKHPIKRVLQIGGYCGYSALVFANEISGQEGAKVNTIEVNGDYASVAKRIHAHAGLDHMIEINLAPVSHSEEFIKKNGNYDMVFIDHIKQLYWSDFVLLEEYGVIKSGALVVGDNIITPGCPEYLHNMKNNQSYDSVLYHSYLEYCEIPDAVLASVKK